MFDYLTQIFTALKTFFVEMFNAIIAVPAAIVNFVIGALDWLKTETVNCAYNFIFDQLANFSSLTGFNIAFSQEDITMFFTNVNVFFPVDELLTMGIFLLDTWLAVRLFKMGLWVLFKFFKPSTLLSLGGGGGSS